MAEHFDLHPNVARHHLEKLTGGGYLVVEIAGAPTDGTARAAGRPSKRYLAGPLDATLALPLKHDDLLGGLLARALDALGPGRGRGARRRSRLPVRPPARRAHGSHRGAPIGPRRGRRRWPTRSPRTGSPRTPKTHDGRLTIVSECCPFGDTAQRYPHVVCALDRGMIRGMLAGLYGETSPQFETSRPDGDDHCVARV